MANFFKFYSFPPKTKAMGLFGIGLLTLLLLDSLTFFLSKQSSSGVLISNQVQANSMKLEEIKSSVLSAETSQRGFLLSHRPSFLKSYEDAKKSAIKAVSFLENEPQSRPLLKELRDHVHAKFAEMDEAVQLGATGNWSGALELSMQSLARQEKKSIVTVIDSILAGNNSRIAELTSDTSANIDRDQWLSMLGIIVEVPIFVLGLALLLAEMHKQEKSERSLYHAAKDLEYANGRLSQLAAERRTFVEVAIHDLKNPLGGIIGFSEMLAEGEAAPEDLKPFGFMIYKSAKRMLDVIENFLSSLRFENQQHIAAVNDISHCDLAAIVREVVDNNMINFKHKNLTLNLHATTKSYWVFVHHDSLYSAIDNLISNAIKYSRTGSEIAVQLQVDGTRVRFSVTDQGPGLSGYELKLLFTRYLILEKQATGGEKSHGIGLATSKQFIEQHGGFIWAESPGPGKGSTFTFDLPLAKSDGYSADSTFLSPPTKDLGNSLAAH